MRSHSTRDVLGVGAEAVAQAMVNKQLAVRDCLPKAANGSHKAPSSPRAAQIMKDMRQNGSREYARLYCVGVCNLDDGVPLELAEAPILMLLAALREHAAARSRARTDRPVLSLLTREAKAHAALPLDELRLANSPTSLAAIDEALADCERYEPALHELEDSLRARRVLLAGEEAARRRGHMQLA